MNRTHPPAPRHEPGWPAKIGPAEVGPGEVADLIERVAVADRSPAQVMDWIAAVCAETVLCLKGVCLKAGLVEVREGARVRSQLAALTPGLLDAGSALSACRRTERRATLRALREQLRAVVR